MKCSVFQAEGDHSSTFTVFHQQVQGEVFNKVITVITERLPVQSVEQRMTGTIGDATASVGLTSFAKLQRLTSESSLVDFTYCGK